MPHLASLPNCANMCHMSQKLFLDVPRMPMDYVSKLTVDKNTDGLRQYRSYASQHASRLRELRRIQEHGEAGPGGYDDTYDEYVEERVPDTIRDMVETGK